MCRRATRDSDLGSLSKDTQVTRRPPFPHLPGAAPRDKACPRESRRRLLPGDQPGVPRGGQLGLGPWMSWGAGQGRCPKCTVGCGSAPGESKPALRSDEDAPFPGVRRNWTCCTWKVARPGPLGPSHCPPAPSSVACGELHDLCGP